MVDAAKINASTVMPTRSRNGVDPISATVSPADEMALARYESLCRDAVHGPAQHPVWIRAWVQATGADAIIATLCDSERPICAVALEVVQQGPFRLARFIGGSHANGNVVPAPHGREPMTEAQARILTKAIHDARPDIDALVLERQNPSQDGALNPLTNLATLGSPNVSLAVDLTGGFDAMLERRNGKRKRKKLRLQRNKFEDEGGYTLIEAKTTAEVDRLIDAFFAMKAARFASKGIPNVFGTAEIQAFFRGLFRGALAHDPAPFVLHGVEVSGEIRAVNGVSVTSDSYVCEFGGIRDDIGGSPGFFLDFTTIQHACELGMLRYDFSVGDEDYKRSWCDLETWQFDTILPLSAKGRVLCSYRLARSHAVRAVKSNDALWAFVKLLRMKAAGSGPVPSKSSASD